MLLRLEEFCSLTDMIRSDTSQILEENIPLLQAKVTEMRGIYAKVDQLEAFVKMVGHHVSFLEAHVLQAERDHGAFPRALQRWLGSAGLPSFRNDAWLQVTATQVNLAEANKRSPGLMDRSRPRVTPASGNDGFGCSNDIVRTSSHSISQLCDPVLASIPGRPCTVVAEVALRFMNHPPPRPWVTAPVGQASHPLQPPPEP
ncbi:breast carcinoma-amplified sequence 4 isoform X4 [Mirounga angustirostris]